MFLHATETYSSNDRHLARLLITIAALLAGTGTARAHQASITHATVHVAHDQTTVGYRLQMAPADTAEALGLAPDTEPTDQDLARGRDGLFDHVLARIAVLDGNTPCAAERGDARITRQGEPFVTLTWRARCAAPIRQLVIQYRLFFDLDPMHRGLLNVHYRGEPAVAELRPGHGRFVWDLDEPPPSGLTGFLVSGIEHIVLGFDHVAFLIGLLLVVVLQRRHDGSWQQRDPRRGLRETVTIVTSFTVAHSLTLVAASLGWIALDGRLVESVIAASIVFVAIENIINPDPGHRHAVTFVFGLIHGLGFASMLQVLLPPGEVLVPLLMFNLGVELGQLAIIVVALPLLFALVRMLDARIYRRVPMPAASAVLAALGAVWLIERVFAVSIIGL